MLSKTSLALFEQKSIRKIWYNEERFFSVVDVIFVLTDSINPTDYLKKLRKRDVELGSYLGTHCPQIEMKTETGKKRKTLAGNTAHILRLIQSVQSPKAEPFKKRLAQVGYERIQEINDPELAQERMKQLYEAKGYSKERIDKRLRGISVRQTLTDEWKQRNITEGIDYALLTAEISKATFGMTPTEYLEHKGLKRQNLRDHMTDLELIFTMLGEASTTAITQSKNAQGFDACADASRAGGKIAGDARQKLEIESGKKVISADNFLTKQQKNKQIEEYSKCNLNGE